jgi:putative sporulation protein YtxC
MKSFCIKTNNNEIIDYLLNRIKEIDFENIVYSKKKFSIYENVTIHYLGDKLKEYYQFLSELLEKVIIQFYEEKLMKQLIYYNYFYFDNYEKNKILDNCLTLANTEEYISEVENDVMKNEIIQYLEQNHSMILDGFVTFRLKKYISCLDDLVDRGVNQFIIEKEYTEFISLLHIYVENKEPEYPLLHLIYINGESIILDEDKNIVSVSDNIYHAKYLSDISFSSNDFALNTLLTLLPRKIEIHLIGKEDEFIQTLKLIFEQRISICRECNICKTYRLLNSAEINH